jgi:hypothetical protein
LRFNLELSPTIFAFGDAVWCARLPSEGGAVFAVSRDRLFFTSIDQTQLYSSDLEASNPGSPVAINSIGGLTWFDGVLYGVAWWPGRLYRIDPDSGLSGNWDLPVAWPRAIAFDAHRLWYLENSPDDRRYVLHAMEWPSRHDLGFAETTDSTVYGLAYGAGKLWISGDAFVYEIDPDKALGSRTLDAATTRRFAGRYGQLSFGQETLWGLDRETSKLCQIKIDSAASQPESGLAP